MGIESRTSCSMGLHFSFVLTKLFESNNACPTRTYKLVFSFQIWQLVTLVFYQYNHQYNQYKPPRAYVHCTLVTFEKYTHDNFVDVIALHRSTYMFIFQFHKGTRGISFFCSFKKSKSFARPTLHCNLKIQSGKKIEQ